MKAQTQHMIGVLRTSIRAVGLTYREVEKRLGVSRGYLSRLFSGAMDLRFDHVAEIAEAIGLEPEEVFRLAFPPRQAPVKPEVLRLREALGANAPASEEMPESGETSLLEKELERIVAKVFAKMFTRLSG